MIPLSLITKIAEITWTDELSAFSPDGFEVEGAVAIIKY
jgi:hypothetical protein